ncbi:DNA-directed RNA polymerase [Phascolarctobacterium faecium]|uniref:DNA-directed RNA polymerase n=1 Tax=Phascolarctobacterium faecium TaxID=33025 RepID=UPI0010330178|nr:DNA-directed RNA polymerase [Phascolarctobacterium faecium]
MEKHPLYFEELELEARYKTFGEQKLRQAYDKAKAEGQVGTTTLGQKFIAHQYSNVFEAVKLFVENTLAPKRGVKPAYVSILFEMVELYKEEKDQMYSLLAFSALSTLMDNMMRRKELFMSNVSQWIGKEIQDEYNLTRYLSQKPSREPIVTKGIDQRVQSFYRRAYAIAWMKRDGYQAPKWDKQDLMQLAASLINIIITTTNYFEYNQQGTALHIQPTQSLLDAWSTNEDNVVANSYRLCPTIIPPKPWTTYDDGGYYGELQSISTLLRFHDQRTVFGKKYLKKLGQMELTGVRKAINSIQATPWKINKKVLAVIQDVMELGGGRAGIPYINEAPKPMVLPNAPTEEQLKEYRKVMVGYYKDETRRKSLALRALGNINLAKEYAKYDKIYFPCNMDFRGRVYPIPNFSFQGDDLNKGLILFADAPACEDMEDINWLAVHGANLAGVDKVSYDDRIQWVKDNELEILASALDPLANTFWMNQDEPCQFLAFCFEWQAWKQWETEHGSPKGFVSGIPVAFDGTCSGLQHFSAILRDPVGGAAVNLLPSDKPNDIYGVVAEKVNVAIGEDLRSGTLDDVIDTKIKFGTKTLAQLWRMYGVTRKVTKRSVMTLAYGSKEYGFRDQIFEDIIKKDMQEQKDASVFTEENCWQASAYMAKLIWNAVRTTVVAAVDGMKWLQDCAKLVTKKGQVVTWTTPMGLPVQQSYMECVSTQVRLRCAGKNIRLYGLNVTGNIDKRAQAQGVAPNFIHSMDASHLQLTVCIAAELGIRHFAMIHDSYGSPVAQAKTMYKAVRQSFIEMYTEQDVLENFKNDMELLSDSKLPSIPAKGTLNLTDILDSRYIFS